MQALLNGMQFRKLLEKENRYSDIAVPKKSRSV